MMHYFTVSRATRFTTLTIIRTQRHTATLLGVSKFVLNLGHCQGVCWLSLPCLSFIGAHCVELMTAASACAAVSQPSESEDAERSKMVDVPQSTTITALEADVDRTTASPNNDTSHEQQPIEEANSFGSEPFDMQLPKDPLPPPEIFDPVQKFVANAIEGQEKEKEGAPPTRTYRALVDAFRFQKDREMLRNIILALRTSANGNTLILVTRPKHARLMHNIVRLNPFASPSSSEIDYSLADAHLNLLMAIVSAKSVFVVPVMLSLWKMVTLGRNERTVQM